MYPYAFATPKAVPTRTLAVDADHPEPKAIKEAADVLLSGGLVAFPTETVYGLGANALDEKAVRRIFEAKGRPADNPLIVHVASLDAVAAVAADVPPEARRLAAAYWPGPLTMVLPRRPEVPDVTTGGLDTVAVRVPNHAVALALLEEANVPVAAPSANRSGSPSPTRANHVLSDLSGRVDVILDGGPTPVGVESTVIDLTGRSPIVLRPGVITPKDLTSVLGRAMGVAAFATSTVARSPGMKYKHYAPRAPLVLVEGPPAAVREALARERARLAAEGRRVGVLATLESGMFGPDVIGLGSRADLASIARDLYARLREIDSRGFDVVLVEGVPAEGVGLAVMDRLRRAAARVVHA